MLLQAGIPRPRFDVSSYPEYYVIHTISKLGVSQGSVIFHGSTDPEHGIRQARELTPDVSYDIDDGLQGHEYTLPFWSLTQLPGMAPPPTQALMQKTGASGYTNKGLVRFFTAGFTVAVSSAFRADSRSYEEHNITFAIVCPATGGGIIRLADSPFDIANPTFNPNALPTKMLPSHEHRAALQTAHRGTTSPRAEQLREARIREVEQKMAQTKALPPGKPDAR